MSKFLEVLGRGSSSGSRMALAGLAVVALVSVGSAGVRAAPANADSPDERVAEERRQEMGEAHYERAQRHYEARRYAEAGRAYLRAAELDVEPGKAYYNAACSFALAGQSDPAFLALGKSLDAAFIELDLLNDDDDLASLRTDARFRALVDRARHTDPAKARLAAAKRRFDALQARHARNEDAWRDVGIDLLRTGEPLRAAQAFRNACAVDSSATQIYNEACALSVAGKTSEALQTLERSILAGSGDAEQIAKDEDLRAVRRLPDYARVVELARDLTLNQNPWIDRRNTTQWRRELPRYERVAQKRPQVGRAWANLAYARLFGKDAAGSIAAYQRALSLGYQPRLTMYNLGCAYAQARNADEAIRWLERSERSGFRVGEEALHDEDLDPLRSDPRFQRMIGRWHSAHELERRAKDSEKHHDEDDED